MITTINNYHILSLSHPLPPCVCVCVFMCMHVCMCVCLQEQYYKRMKQSCYFERLWSVFFCHLSSTNPSFGFKIRKIIVSKHNSQSDLLPSNFLQICALFPLYQEKNEKFLIPFSWIQTDLGTCLCKCNMV